jgi:hypothetical protein
MRRSTLLSLSLQLEFPAGCFVKLPGCRRICNIGATPSRGRIEAPTLKNNIQVAIVKGNFEKCKQLLDFEGSSISGFSWDGSPQLII